jgi:hypothetical protein
LQFEFFVDSGVIASKDAYTHNGDGNRIVLRQEKLSLAVAGEIVNAIGGKSIWQTWVSGLKGPKSILFLSW